MKAFLVALVIAGMFGGAALAAPKPKTESKLERTIAVTGTGEVSAKPDMATITVGVVTEGESAKEVVKENSARMTQLFDALKAQGIAEKDMQTANFSLQPRYKYDNSGRVPPQITGYSVSNQVQIKVRQLASLGATLDAVVQSGANQVQGISFSVSESSKVLDEARAKAIQDARRKAGVYALAAGVGVGQPLQIQEQSVNFPQPVAMRAMMSEAQSAVPVATGEQTLSASVQVVYALEGESAAKKEAVREKAEHSD